MKIDFARAKDPMYLSQIKQLVASAIADGYTHLVYNFEIQG
jgi:hypothetical protein